MIAVGAGVIASPMSGPVLGGVVLAMGLTVCLWWTYFVGLAGAAENALVHRHGDHSGRVATAGNTYLHLLLVAGIVLVALGNEVAMSHFASAEPLGLFGAIVLGGGAACFLCGTAIFARRVVGTWRITRLGGPLACSPCSGRSQPSRQ